MKLLIIAILTISFGSALADPIEVMLRTKQGKLLGTEQQTKNGKIYYSFTNIPYAKPPLGKLRFEPPVEASNWRGIRGILYTPICYHWILNFGVSNFFGMEDCLYLNVFTPNITEEANLPVVVCIHGGEFQKGSSYECPANNFVEKDLVFVSINYRLGVLGFLSTGDERMPGNNGLKDQVAALKWVHKYIAAYGGDANKITILGQNAGGVSVHLHMFSELSQGLFHSAISQSGAALVPWSITPIHVAKNRTRTLAKLINCPDSSTIEMLTCLKKTQAKTLVELQPQLHLWIHEPRIVFTPVIEPSSVKDAFLTKDPWIEEETFVVPWLLGLNSGEGIVIASFFFDQNKSLSKINEDFDRVLPFSLFYEFTAAKEKVSEITASLKNYYFKDKDISSETIHEFINLLGDGLIKYACVKSALRYKGRKYFYLFDHQIENSFSKIFHKASGLQNINLVSHGDEFVTLFTLSWSEPEEVTFNDAQVARRMLEYWTNFIKTGNPNNEDQVEWEPALGNDFKYLHIKTENDQMMANLAMNEEQYYFWDSLPLNSPQKETEITADKTPNDVTKDEL